MKITLLKSVIDMTISATHIIKIKLPIFMSHNTDFESSSENRCHAR